MDTLQFTLLDLLQYKGFAVTVICSLALSLLTIGYAVGRVYVRMVSEMDRHGKFDSYGWANRGKDEFMWIKLRINGQRRRYRLTPAMERHFNTVNGAKDISNASVYFRDDSNWFIRFINIENDDMDGYEGTINKMYIDGEKALYYVI